MQPVRVDDDIMCYNGRRLPTLFIIGSQKCATTSLARKLFDNMNYTRGLPFGDWSRYSDSKEHNFFNDEVRWRRGLQHYAASFPACASSRRTLDATPDYLYTRGNPGTAERLVRMYGPARVARTTFVASLCEPIRRAQSALYHFREIRDGRHHAPWIETSIDTTRTSFRSQAHRDVLAHRLGSVIYAYGRYAEQVDEWLNATGRLRIIPLPLYSKHEQATLSEVDCLVAYRSVHARDPPDPSECNFSAIREPPSGPRIGSHAHPPLAADLYREDAAVLTRSFRWSNQRIYDTIAHDPRVAVLPCCFNASAAGRFLDLQGGEQLDTAPVFLGFDLDIFGYGLQVPQANLGRAVYTALALFGALEVCLIAACLIALLKLVDGRWRWALPRDPSVMV